MLHQIGVLLYGILLRLSTSTVAWDDTSILPGILVIALVLGDLAAEAVSYLAGLYAGVVIFAVVGIERSKVFI